MYKAYSLWRLCLLLWTLFPFSLSAIFTNLLVGSHFWGLKLDVEAVVYSRADPLCILWFLEEVYSIISILWSFWDYLNIRLWTYICPDYNLSFGIFHPFGESVYLYSCFINVFWFLMRLWAPFLVISYASVVILSVIKFYCVKYTPLFWKCQPNIYSVILKFINYPSMLIVVAQIQFFNFSWLLVVH